MYENSLQFLDVKHLLNFECYLLYETDVYWNMIMWDILAKHGLTSYTSDKERTEVILRAVSLAMLRCEWQYVTSGNTCRLEWLVSDAMEMTSEFSIGQLWGMSGREFSSNICRAVCALAGDMRSGIIDAISQEFPLPVLFYSLTAITQELLVPLEMDYYEYADYDDGDHDDVFDCQEEVELIPRSAWEFWEQFRTHFKEYVNLAKKNVKNFKKAYEWITSGAAPRSDMPDDSWFGV